MTLDAATRVLFLPAHPYDETLATGASSAGMGDGGVGRQGQKNAPRGPQKTPSKKKKKKKQTPPPPKPPQKKKFMLEID